MRNDTGEGSEKNWGLNVGEGMEKERISYVGCTVRDPNRVGL